MNKIKKILLLTTAITVLMLCFVFSSSAANSGYYTYEIVNGKAKITDVNTAISGDVIVPSKLGGYTVAEIGEEAFRDCKAIKTIVIPNNITKINKYSFWNCDGMTKVEFGTGLDTITSFSFFECDSLQTIIIGKNVKTIGGYAFGDCVSLKTIVWGGRLETIEGNAFEDCSSLFKVVIPDTVTKISSGTFIRCKGMVELTIGSKVQEIGANAFEDCESLRNVVIPNSVKTMGEYAFANCDDLTNVKIGAGLKVIPGRAFIGCDMLKSFTNGKNVETIGWYAFYNCSRIADLDLGAKLIEIGWNAFEDCTSIKSIVIPDSVEIIGAYAFQNCDSATELSLGKKVREIKSAAFAGCDSITSVDIPDSVTTLEDTVFYSCSKLNYVQIGNGVTSLKRSAFEKCEELKKVVFGNSITNIGEDSFSECSLLDNVILPDSVTSIDSDAFYCCSALKILYFGENITKIGWHAFNGCSSLEVVMFPEALKEIGRYAFCSTNLRKVYLPKYLQKIDMYAFSNHETITDVYFGGSEDDSEYVTYYGDNKNIINAKWHYNHSHTFKKSITPATTSADGSINSTCSVCEGLKVTAIPRVKTIKLSTTKYIYDGKNKTPKVTVKDSAGNTLVKGTDYTLTVASKRSAIGRHTVKVTFKGKYKGTKNVYFYILPAAPTSPKASSQTTSSVKIFWSAVKGATGYKVYRYSPSKKAYVYVGATTKTYATVKSLLKGTAYTFRVYAYTKTSSGTVYNSSKYLLIKTATACATPTISLATTVKGRATVAWTNVAGETGYQVYYATSKTGTYKKIANYKANTTKIYKTGLTSGKTYYFKVRAYTNTDTGYVYSAYSPVKGIKIK